MASRLSQDRLQRLLRLSIEASERDRERWARELHDETLQELGALRLVLDQAHADGGLSSDSRESALEHLDRGIRNLQGLIAELRPSVLDELGVGPAIESLARRKGDRFGVEILVELDLGQDGDVPARLPADAESTIYRVVQEATGNAAVHGKPERITVTVSRRQDRVEVIVSDDGRGFDQETTEPSFGLIGMEERLLLAGGHLTLQSAPGQGTTLRAELPIGSG